MISVRRLEDDLLQFYDLLFDPDFMKSSRIGNASEQWLSPRLRFFLGAKHVQTWPESRHDELTRKGIITGWVGRPRQIDFWVDGVPLEVASRSASEGAGKLHLSSNRPEIDKLSSCTERGLLALMDFEKHPVGYDGADIIQQYQNGVGAVLGRRVHNFRVTHYFRAGTEIKKRSADFRRVGAK
jgi:hypothetical protein